VHEIAQGRVWSGVKGKELGLVDELGGLDRAIELAREKAKLGKDAPVRYEREEKSLIEQVLDQALAGEPEKLARALDARLGPLDDALRALERVQRMLGATGVLARLPFELPAD
jgi:protease-4